MPSGFSDADTTNRIGKSEKTSASTPIRWLQPTRRNQPPLAPPRRTTSVGWGSGIGTVDAVWLTGMDIS